MSKWSSAYRDSRWQQKRLAVMERDEWKCRLCHKSGDGVLLNVHHAYYESGRAPWEYDDDTLITWCDSCHMHRHQTMKRLALLVAHMNNQDFSTIMCVADHGTRIARAALRLAELMAGTDRLTVDHAAIASATIEEWCNGMVEGLDKTEIEACQ